MSEQSAVAPSRNAYTFGFNYSIILVFLNQLTGLSVHDILVVVRPFLIAFVVPVSFILYRLFLDDITWSALATLLLLVQPEFLFAILRGGHEVITWFLVLFGAFLLARNLSLQGKIASQSKYIIAFYLAMFTLICTSVFFASSFIFGLFLSLIIT